MQHRLIEADELPNPVTTDDVFSFRVLECLVMCHMCIQILF